MENITKLKAIVRELAEEKYGYELSDIEKSVIGEWNDVIREKNKQAEVDEEYEFVVPEPTWKVHLRSGTILETGCPSYFDGRQEGFRVFSKKEDVLFEIPRGEIVYMYKK